MQDIKIIDTHAHIYPKKIAEKAVTTIGNFYDKEMENSNATSEDLLISGKEINVNKYVVCSTATTVKQVQSINNFIVEEVKKHKEFIGFATLHPDMEEEDIFNEVQRIINMNLQGIKLHPDFQLFDIDEKRAEKIYRACNDKLPILFHTGDDRFDYSSPLRLAKIAKKYPHLQCIAAHFGGYNRWSEIDSYDKLDNIFFDTSSSLFKLDYLMAKDIIKHIGYEKFMFGCDFPMWNHKAELERFLNLNFNDKINEDILSNNAQRILNIKL